MKSSGKRKLSLMWTIISSLAMVGTASVATFAWFQASAAAEVHTASTSTTITVNKPDDFTFLEYRGNRQTTWPSKGSFANDFVEVTSETIAPATTFSNYVPGKNYVYCIKAENASSLNIYISKIISNSATKQGMAHERVTYDGAHNVNVGWAIDIFEYEEVANHGSNPTSGYTTLVGKLVSDSNYGDRFNFSETTNRTVLEDAGTGVAPNKVISLASSVGIYDNSISSLNYAKSTAALDSTKDMFVFFSVVYSDHNSTYYREVKGSSDPSDVIVSPTNRDRYFKKGTDGNSNCYAGLKFALTQIDVTIG